MATLPLLNRPEVRSYGPPILFALLGVVLLLVLALPSWGRFQDLRQQVADEKLRITTLQEKNAKLLDMADQSAAVDEGFALFDQAVASESKIPELLTQVQKISDSCGVSVTTLQFGGETEQAGGRVQEVRLQYAIESSFSELNCLVSAIEGTSRLIDMESLRYSSNVNEETGAVTLSTQSTLISYYTQTPVLNPDNPITFSLSDPTYLRNLDLLEAFKIY